MKIEVAKRLQQTEEYYFSKKLREIDQMNKAGDRVINLGIGNPDLPPHPDVIRELHTQADISQNHGYQSYKGSPVLRQAISTWYQNCYQVALNPETDILPLIGSKEGIVHICMTYLQEGDEVLIPNPGYPTYTSAVRLTGATIVPYILSSENNWLIDFDALEKTDLSKVKILWMNYPHMPTGAAPTKDFFKRAVDFARKHNILIVHDNPYSLILNETAPLSILSIPGALEVAIELNSLSKSANMAGWRIGMLLANEDRVNEILRFKSNMDSGMFLPAQLAAAKALSLDPSWHEENNKIYAQRREKVYEIMDILQCSYDRNQVGLFIWGKIPVSYSNSYDLADITLNKAKVFITPGGIFGSAGEQYVRISLCSSIAVLDAAIDRLKTSLSREE